MIGAHGDDDDNDDDEVRTCSVAGDDDDGVAGDEGVGNDGGAVSLPQSPSSMGNLLSAMPS